MATRFSISGWRTSTIAPKYSAPAAAVPVVPQTTASSNVGPVNAAAQSPLTAAALQTTPQTLNDPKLGSRLFTSTVPGRAQPFLAESVYQRPELPSFLQQSIADLNSEQALKRSLQSEWASKVLGLAQGGGKDAYLWQEAARALSVQPGSHVSFGAAVQSPEIGAGYRAATTGYANQANATAGAIGAPNAIQAQIAALQQEKARIGANSFGGYQNSRQQAIDSQLFDLNARLSGANMVASGQGRTSGWTAPTLPY